MRHWTPTAPPQQVAHRCRSLSAQRAPGAAGEGQPPNHLYTGREWQPGLGVYDYRQRLYSPATGRFLTTDPADDPNNLGNPYTYVGNNPGTFVDPYGLERWGEQSYFADVADVGYGFFIGGPVELVGGIASSVAHPIRTAAGIASLAGNLYDDPLGTSGNLAGSFYAQFEDSDTAGEAAFGAASSLVPSAAGAVKAGAAAARIARGTRALETAAAVEAAAGGVAAAESGAGMAGQATMRARVLANIAESRAARTASEFDIHIATEKIYANAGKAVETTKNAGLTNKYGALGMRAHKEFASLNAATAEELAGRGIGIDVEPYRLYGRQNVPRSTKGSLSVDAMLSYRGKSVRGFDLKTGRPWPKAGLMERERRFGVDIQQIHR